jgi:hypothetical protein
LVVAVDPTKFESPEYVAVIASDPAGAPADVHDPVPLTSCPVTHNTFEPFVKVTVPVGVPLAEVTVAE